MSAEVIDKLGASPGWDCHVHVFDGAAPVMPGHYQPQHRPLADIETLAQAHGASHLVLVQPSVYGTDNTVLLDALRASGGRHRGVVVVDASVSDAALEDMHRLGVRGIRFNLVSPVGSSGSEDAARCFAQLAPRLRALGWHVQWYARPQDLGFIAGLHSSPAAAGIPAVLDHLAGLHAELPADDVAWQALRELAQTGAWVKLSGWYRLKAGSPYSGLNRNILQVAGLFPQRMVWGSDWPHTSFAADALPGYRSLQQPLLDALPPEKIGLAMSASPASLYS